MLLAEGSIDVIRKDLSFKCTASGVNLASSVHDEAVDEVDFTWNEWNELVTAVQKVKTQFYPKPGEKTPET